MQTTGATSGEILTGKTSSVSTSITTPQQTTTATSTATSSTITSTATSTPAVTSTGSSTPTNNPIGSSSPTQVTTPSSTSLPVTQTVTITGTSVNTPYGPIQVEATVNGKTITAINVLEYPNNDRKSQRINQTALPTLTQQALLAQTSEIDGVSGATYTSEGYKTSLQAIIDKL